MSKVKKNKQKKDTKKNIYKHKILKMKNKTIKLRKRLENIKENLKTQKILKKNNYFKIIKVKNRLNLIY